MSLSVLCRRERTIDLPSRSFQTDRHVDTIRLDEDNTVKTLRDQLFNLVSVEEDGGFPILKQEDGGLRMLGYIGANELEHALSIVADEADTIVAFHTTSAYSHPAYGASSITSLIEEEGANEGAVGDDPFDFSIYMDKAPLTVQDNSPLELIQEFFTKLGARYVVVTDSDGYCEFFLRSKLCCPRMTILTYLFSPVCRRGCHRQKSLACVPPHPRRETLALVRLFIQTPQFRNKGVVLPPSPYPSLIRSSSSAFFLVTRLHSTKQPF